MTKQMDSRQVDIKVEYLQKKIEHFKAAHEDRVNAGRLDSAEWIDSVISKTLSELDALMTEYYPSSYAEKIMEKVH